MYDQIQLKIQKKKKIESKQDLIKIIAPKLAQMLVNIIQLGPRVILRSAFQLLRASPLTRAVSMCFLVIFDMYNLVTKKISKKQFLINITLAVTLMIGGTIGWNFGSNFANVFIENLVLAIFAGLVGAVAIGSVLCSIAEKILLRIIRSDIADMLDIFNQEFKKICEEKSLTLSEAEALADKIVLKHQTVQSLFLYVDKRERARSFLESFI